MKKSSKPSTISLIHYGNYQNMSPSSATRARNAANINPNNNNNTKNNNNNNNNNYYDNQHMSLFGDPVHQFPPQEEFLENLDRNLYRGFRSNSNSSSLLEDFTKPGTYVEVKNEKISFDEPNDIRAISGSIKGQTFDPGDIRSINSESFFRTTTGPGIQILPESDSSSDNRASPRYTNLENYEQRLSSNPSDIVDYVDARFLDENRNANDNARRLSEFSEDIHDSFEKYKDTREMIIEPNRIFSAEPSSMNKNIRQYSNESLSSNDWFKPDYQDFTKIPKLRPSSKNVMSINRQQIRHESPVATLFNDSGGSCSDGEKPVDVRPSYIEPLPNIRQQQQQQLQSGQSPSQIPISSPKKSTINVPEKPSQFELTKSVFPDSLHKPLNVPEPIPKGLPPTGMPHLSKREVSPVIVTNAICTGADYRINAPRSHKKPSFTIIKEKPSLSSNIPSPRHKTSHKVTTKSDRSALSARLEKDLSRRPGTLRQNLPQRSMSSHQLKLPRISGFQNQNTSNESPRPSVQFNMSSGIRSFSKSSNHINNVPKGILQQKHPGMPFSGMPSTATQNTRVRSFETLPLKLPPLPNFITPRTPSHRFNKSTSNLNEEVRSSSAMGYNRPFYAIQNPTSRERGLLRVMNSAGSSPSRIPVVKSHWIPTSMGDLSDKRGKSMSPLRRASLSPPNKIVKRRGRSMSPTFFDRRSSSQTDPRSSISSDRRSSNITSITTSDFSFRRNSISPTTNFTSKRTSSSGAINNKTSRRKSIFQSEPSLFRQRSDSIVDRSGRMSKSQRKVAKPTSLSPIIGTPNKDDPLSPEEIESSERFIASGLNFTDNRSDSLTRIPIRNGSDVITRSESRIQSQSNSRSNSRGASLPNSRSGSPMKDFTPASRPNSRAASLSPSKHTSKSTSRAGSQPSSKPQSRGNSRSTSRQPSRATSRTGSRTSSTHKENIFQQSNPSRSNSRLSISPPKSRKTSPPKQTSSKRSTKSNSKIRSPSPKKSRRKSVSPPKPSGRSNSRSRVRNKSPDKRNQSSKSKTTKSSSRSRSPQKSSRRDSPKRSSVRKIDNKSAKSSMSRKNSDMSSSRVSSFRKKEGESALKREPSSLKRGTSNLKRETSNLKKDTPTTLKRETSNLRKDTPMALKRETSNLKKDTPTALKRETSGLKKETSNLKREPSRMSLKKGTPTSVRKEPVKKNISDGIKKEPSNPKIDTSPPKLTKEPSNLLKKRTDSNLSKKLEKKNSFKNEKANTNTTDSATAIESIKQDGETMTDSDGKLIPMTKANVISMTTAAIAAQPVQITTAVTNHALLGKTNSSGQLINPDAKSETSALPATILEKSTKTLENIQKTVTEATDEIQKTIHENLTDLKSLESDMGKGGTAEKKSSTPFEKSDSLKTIKENPATRPSGKTTTNGNNNSSPAPPTQPIEASVSVVKGGSLHPNRTGETSDGQNGNGNHKDDERVSVRAISVLPDVECESANLQNSSDIQQVLDDPAVTTRTEGSGLIKSESKKEMDMTDISAIKVDGEDNKTQSGGGADNNLNKIANETGPQGSQEFLTGPDEETTGCCGRSKCCRCCTRICMPCRRCKCSTSKCCTKKPDTTSDATAVIVNEKAEKTSCWKKMKCCKRKKFEPMVSSTRMETIAEETEIHSAKDPDPEPKRGKCSMCLRKIFCCRAANKIETTTIDDEVEVVKKCCFCIPCKRKVKKPTTPAWQAPPPDPPTSAQRRESILSQGPPGPPQTRCQRIMNKLKFWKKKEPLRKTSITSRKQSLVPTNPPEDTRPKLHNDLVEYNSRMKGAIPVLPIYLAYFCTACNIIIPGLGTILSGFFCLCFGIPRFSQYDSVKARIGSCIINCFVGVAQFFCVLFCFVGWGWSIWWGTIMMKTARKLQKVRKVERLELEEEQRQAAAAAAAAATSALAHPHTAPQAAPAPAKTDKDVEAAKK